MIVRVREFYSSRSTREQRLLLLMLGVALALLGWLLVVQPLGRAYDEALQAQLEAVDRHGRVAALAEAATSAPARPRTDGDVDLQLAVTEAAGQAGLALQSATPAGGDSIDVTTEGAPAPVIGQWLRDFEARGIRVEQMRMIPQGGGLVTLSARLSRR